MAQNQTSYRLWKQKKVNVGGYFAIVFSTLAIGILFSCSRPQSSSQAVPPFFLDQITDDLKGFHIDKDTLNATWATLSKIDSHYVRYKHIQGRLTAATDPKTRDNPRYLVITQALARVFSLASFPDIDCIVFLGDSLEKNVYPIPVLAFAKPRGEKGIALIPDCEALNPDDRAYLTTTTLQASLDNTWAKKVKQVFWRGAPTGPRLNTQEIENDDWIKSPRFQLAKLSEKTPERVNAFFVSWNGITENKELLAAKFSLGNPVHPKDHLPYKYLIDIDGNSCCYSRTYWILLSNSLMLKQSTENVQWFYQGLKPNIHYIPLQYDLSDLEEQIAWVETHDKEAFEIAQNSTNFALKYLQYDANICYLSALLQEYARHQKFEPHFSDSDVEATIPFSQKALFKIKGMLRKKIKKQPIA